MDKISDFENEWKSKHLGAVISLNYMGGGKILEKLSQTQLNNMYKDLYDFYIKIKR